MYAIVKVRGNIGVRNDVIHNLKLLNLTRVNHCVLFQETEKIKGMLKKVRIILHGVKFLKKPYKNYYIKEGKFIKIKN